MGFLSRLHKVATGVGGALQAPFGLAFDLARSPWKDEDEFDGLVNTLYSRTVARGGQVLGNLVGPDEGLGAVFGGAPQGLRSPVRAVTAPVLSGLETVYREGIAEPVSAAITTGSLADAPGGGGVAGLFRGENWREGYRIAQDRSPGQALAVAFGTKDITDEAEVVRYAGTDSYRTISGVADAVLRLRADPSVLAGRAAKATRAKFLVRPIETAADIDRAMASPRVARFASALEGRTASEIRDRFFPDHANGAVVSAVLADAPDHAARYSTLRALMGDVDELEALRANHAGLAGKVERLTAERNELVRWADDSLFSDPERLARVRAEIDDLHPEVDRARRLEAAFATVNAVPRVSLSGRVRTSEWYQESAFARPLHVVFDMRPQQLVNLHATDGDVQVARMLRKSALDPEVQDGFRSRYMAALDPGERQVVLVQAEEAAVRSLAEKAGMTVDEVAEVMAGARKGRASAAEVLKGRVYDGQGRSKVYLPDDNGAVVEMHLPLWATQEANVLPLADLDAVRKATTRIGQWKLRHPRSAVPTEIMDGFMKVWRPAVLLRPAWPVRIVMDEQLRIMAKIGALSQARSLGSAAGREVADRLARIPKEQRGNRWFTARNYDLEGAFGAPGDAANVSKALNSARASFDSLVGQEETRILGELRSHTGQWQSLAPDKPGHGEAWAHAVNRQIGQDAMGTRFLRGDTPEQVADWLRSTPEGQAYVSARNPLRRGRIDEWVQEAAAQVDDYLPTPELKALALGRKATPDDLAKVFPDPSTRPVVHGEVLAESIGGTQVSRMFNGIVQGLFDKLGRAPTDVLSRNRYFDHVYRAEASRLVDLLDEQFGRKGLTLDEGLLRQVEAKARTHALAETRKLLYDLAERSDLAEMLRFVAPFYSAWQEVVTRWAGLAVENPAFIARARLAWNSPEKAGWVVDENGHRVDETGQAWDWEGKKVVAGGERMIRVRVPEWAKDVPGLEGLASQGEVRFDKKGFNLAMQGYPGTGPIVNIPVNEIVKNRPDLEKSVAFVLPFGASQEIRDMLLPASWKRLQARTAGEDDRAYSNAMLRIWQSKVVDYNLGKRDTPPTWDEAKKEADAFFSLRTVASATLPVAPRFVSPYQLWIDAYRQRRELDATLDHEAPDYVSPDEWFLDTFGEEFFPLTTSLSQSVDGVPPTIEGWAAREKYRDLIEEMPELGGLIVGADGAGEFNAAVYAGQFADRVAKGSSDNQRRSRSFEEFAQAPDVSLGWIEFSRAMDLVDAERIQRGLPNLQVKGARDLALLKRAVIERLSEKHPAWYEAFSVTDRNKAARRLEGLRRLSADERLGQRDDMKGLARYIQARDALSAELASRKTKTLTATANRDLALLWETVVEKLKEENLSFAALHHRWLDRDVPEAA